MLRTKLFFLFFLFLITIFSKMNLISSVTLGTNNFNGVVLNQPVAAPVNYSTVNVNNSDYLDGYDNTDFCKISDGYAQYNFAANDFTGTGKFITTNFGNFSKGIYMGGVGKQPVIHLVGNNSGDEFYVAQTGAFRVQRASSNSEAFRTQVNGDSWGRWVGTSDGRLKFGNGTSTQEIQMLRNTNNVLSFNNLTSNTITINIQGILNLTNEFNMKANVTAVVCSEGAIYYDGELKGHYGCNGTGWYRLY